MAEIAQNKMCVPRLIKLYNSPEGVSVNRKKSILRTVVYGSEQ